VLPELMRAKTRKGFEKVAMTSYSLEDKRESCHCCACCIFFAGEAGESCHNSY